MTGNGNRLLADARHSQLLVIDIQTRLVKVMSERDSLLRNCETLITAAKTLSVPVTVTEQYPKALGNTEAVLSDALPPQTTPIEKTCFSSCAAQDFDNNFTYGDKSQAILCGIESHVCVLQTAMDLLSKNQQVFVVADAVASRSRDNKSIALNRMQQAGAIITSTESVLFEWMKDAKHEHFKTISALIR
ncbi:hydrolase [Kaarinaea lacus]